ncbi:MAG: gliding motility-associated C-terminal domain-containing protein [Saprospiraceae bacterium]
MITRTLLLLNSCLLLLSFGKSSFFSQQDIYNNQDIEENSFSIVSPDDFCDGTLGENIFTDGDFGSGAANVLPNDLNGYAPSYAYQPNPPPDDGFYTITNNTTTWGSFAAAAWINIGDNSSDPEGYMMVINASFDPGFFYEKTVDNLCENTFYQFSADVISLLNLNSNEIKPNLDFLIDGVVQYSTGAVPNNTQWNTYGFTFTSDPGTTSLTLAIRNNAPGGLGNDLAIDNIEFRACGPEIDASAESPFFCSGQPATVNAIVFGTQYPNPYFQWQISTDNGVTWNDLIGENSNSIFVANPVDGHLYRTLVSNSIGTIGNSKCRVISNQVEMIESPSDFIQYDTLCQGLELQVGNSVYNSTGMYVDSLIASNNCDSIIITFLEIVPDLGITADLEITPPGCLGENNGAIIISNIQNGFEPYTFSINGAPAQTNPNIENLSAGSYAINIMDNFQCETTLEAVLVDPSALQIDLGEDVTIKLGESYNLQVQSNLSIESFLWLEMEGLNCSTDCLNPNLSPFQTTTYTLVATDEAGCSTVDSITIFVDNTRNIFIPNAFSPNGDGANDYFTVYGGIDVEEVVNFQVFNRWGGVVFSNKNFQPNDDLIGWNGFFKGKNVNTGVYIFSAEVLFKDGLIERYSGDVTVTE